MDRLRLIALRCFTVLSLVVIALSALRIGVGDYLSSDAPNEALAWWPASKEATLRVAKARILSPTAKIEGSTALADQMLKNSPLSGTAYSLLAGTADKAGDTERAFELYKIAARLRPRDRQTHAWLADYAGLQGNWVEVVSRLDQLLRLSPQSIVELFPTLESLAANDQAGEALSATLANHAPAWRHSYLQQLASSSKNSAIVSAVFNSLRQGGAVLTADELEMWTNRLMRDGHVSQAYFLWVDSLSDTQLNVLGNVFDGGFELDREARPFGWHVTSAPGALVRRQWVAGAGGRQALSIKFQYRHVTFRQVTQTLTLPKGDYSLRGRLKLDGLQSERGLRWVVSCLPGGEVVAETEFFSGRAAWREFDRKFSIPATNCRSQALTLELPARVRREQWIGGQVWFDDLSIRRHVDAPEDFTVGTPFDEAPG